MIRLAGWLADAVDESTDDESAADPNAKGAAMQADEVRTNERRVGFDFMWCPRATQTNFLSVFGSWSENVINNLCSTSTNVNLLEDWTGLDDLGAYGWDLVFYTQEQNLAQSRRVNDASDNTSSSIKLN